MKDVVFFSVADANNVKYANGLENSLRKWHPDAEFKLFGPSAIAETNDPHIFYRATPYFGLYLMMQEGYKTVIKIDADSVITGDLTHVWEGDFDVATVHNSNPKEFKKIQVILPAIGPDEYQNCGFVVMRSHDFVKQWLALCMSHRFDALRYREQDILNNMIYWGRWKVKFLDRDCDNKWHGLISKGYELKMELVGLKGGLQLKGSELKSFQQKLILPKNDEYPQDSDKEIICWHEAGGNLPNKMNFHTLFKEEAAKWLMNLVK